jgi:hypothetical protein
MKTSRVIPSVVWLAAILSTSDTHAFSITSVTLSPGNNVPPGAELQMNVNITTPGQPPFLYAPTVAYSDSTGIHIDIFPGSGALTAIGYLRETVALGPFAPGTYNYQVVLHPDPHYGPIGWGVRTNRGTFTVQSDPTLPTVGLSSDARTAEPCPTCLVAPAVILISRSDPTNAPLSVTLADDRGTATSGSDYQPIPATVTIPAGQRAVELLLFPVDDQLVEGPEVARVRLLPSSSYQIRPSGDQSLVTIFDDEANAPTARLDIISPTNGARFLLGRTIELSALAVNVSNEVYGPVEFYAGDQLVARSPVIATARPAIPGVASIHTAHWTNPPLGEHTLTARTELSSITRSLPRR